MRSYDVIHEIALDQHGLVTVHQARERGVAPTALVMMARRGRLERLARGVYQDLGAPTTPFTGYLAAAYWHGRDKPAVLSHETALHLLNLSDANPSAIHLTVPPRLRTTLSPPPGVVVHRAQLGADEITNVEGVAVTTAARAIRDCARSGLGPALLQQAIRDGRRTGHLSPPDAVRLHAELVAAGLV